MHYYQDYKVFIPETNFTLHQFGRPEADQNSAKTGAKSDISGSSPQIDWYIDAREKIWLGKVPAENSVGAVFHEVISNSLYRDVFAKSKSIKVPKAISSRVVIHPGVATQTHGLTAGTQVFSVMSKRVSEFHEFGKDIVDQIALEPRLPLTVPHPTDSAQRIPVTSFWSLAAYSKWFGDIDFIGTTGGNAGYQIKTDASGELSCKTVKIDPGFVGYGEGRSPEEVTTKEIVFSTAGESIDPESLLPEEKREFFQTIQEIVNYSDSEIRQLTSKFDVEGLGTEEIEEFNQMKDNLSSLLIERREGLKELYKDELSQLPAYIKILLPEEEVRDSIELSVADASQKVGVIWSGLSAGIGAIASKWAAFF